MTGAVLVTGGAGYIGSHTVRQLVAAGYRVVVLDDLSTGHRWAVAPEATLVVGNAGNKSLVGALIEEHGVGAVLHFAGSIVVPESVADPLKYYGNNSAASRNLIEACVAKGVARFIFSSTAAVYGIPDRLPVAETAPTRPINPYGRSKLVTEWMLEDVAASSAGGAFKHVILRYFNVAGASLDGTLGQATENATHLIKVACEAACGAREKVIVFGTDYPTADGTCIRDYIHVEDLARAHLDALRYLEQGGASDTFNCGYGRGYSVREVLKMVEKVSGKKLRIEEGARRPGDPAALVAESGKFKNVLDWAASYEELDIICLTAYRWEARQRERAAQSAQAAG
ncbi:MAG TPA: UDP-glucose 4-epimerase GalE [Burkholderiales bacterium]|nr:UDP-glucose 4-epimerase GalE [Burkholderiales bacterium]